MKDKKAQVWVETVVYTLIGLVLIGTVLTIAIPVIQKQKDKAVIEKTHIAVNELDNNILIVKRNGIGNIREVNFFINKGTLTFNGVEDKIIFEIKDSSYAFSEVGDEIPIAGTNLKANTKKFGKKFSIILKLDYTDKINITYFGKEQNSTLSPGATPYILLIENKGRLPDENSNCPTTSCYPKSTCKDGRCVPDLVNINIVDLS